MTINRFQKKMGQAANPALKKLGNVISVQFFSPGTFNSRRFQASREYWPSKPLWFFLRNLFTALCLSFTLQRHPPPG